MAPSALVREEFVAASDTAVSRSYQRWSIVICIALGVGASGEARADPASSYHEQTLAADGLAVALVAAALQQTTVPGGEHASARLMWTGMAAFVTAAPLVHLGHGRGDRAALDVAMRAAPMLLSLAVYESAASRCGPFDDECWSGANRDELIAVTLGVVGSVAAIAVDSAVLARGERAARVMPVVSAGGGATTVGLAGRF